MPIYEIEQYELHTPHIGWKRRTKPTPSHDSSMEKRTSSTIRWNTSRWPTITGCLWTRTGLGGQLRNLGIAVGDDIIPSDSDHHESGVMDHGNCDKEQAMATYEIEQFELYIQGYLIEADNEADAIARFLRGEGKQ